MVLARLFRRKQKPAPAPARAPATAPAPDSPKNSPKNSPKHAQQAPKPAPKPAPKASPLPNGASVEVLAVREELDTRGRLRCMTAEMRIGTLCLSVERQLSAVTVRMLPKSQCAPRNRRVVLTREDLEDATAMVYDAYETLHAELAKRSPSVQLRSDRGGVALSWPKPAGRPEDLGAADAVLNYVARTADALVGLLHADDAARYPLPNRLAYPNMAWRRPNKRAPRERPRAPPAADVNANTVPRRAVPSALRRHSVHDVRDSTAQPRVAEERHEELGKGGFGVVRKQKLTAGDVEGLRGLTHRVPQKPRVVAGQTVAVKYQVLMPVKNSDEQDVRAASRSDLARAIQETRVQCKLAEVTDFVPKVLASGVLHDASRPADRDRGTYVIVMELVRGVTVDQYLKNHGFALPAALFAKIEKAAAALWLAGYAHTDLNPRNIMVVKGKDGADDVKVIDYGLVAHLPAALVPTSMQQALSRQYQNRLLTYLDGLRRGVPRYAGDPHILRWLHQFVR